MDTVTSTGPSTKAMLLSAAAVAVAFPLDGRVRNWAQKPARQDNGVLRNAADVLTPLGSTVAAGTGVALFAFAHLTHRPVLADEVWHSGQAVIYASTYTQILKFLTHRTRPYVPPHDPGTIFHGSLTIDAERWSFPSGHTTFAFAVAGAASEELKLHGFPHANLIEGTLFTLAGGVGLARIYDDKHWLSDVVLGAAIGTFASRRWVRYQHRRRTDGDGDAGLQLVILPGRVSTVGVRVPLRH